MFSKKYCKWILLFVLAVFIILLPFKSFNDNDYKNYIKVIKEYPHKVDSFTEGLFFYDDMFFESTGLYGQSKIYKNINLETGQALDTYSFNDNVFAEGSTIFNDKLYVLSYKEGKVMIFDKGNLELKKEVAYSREGWGLTTDLEYLIASDGSSNIYFMDEDLNDVKKVSVTYNGKKIYNINELEYIDGYIWANVWMTDDILIIKPNGEVLKRLDFSGILPDNMKRDSTDVLNGIAYHNNRLYITGKNYPKLFECEIKDNLYREIKR